MAISRRAVLAGLGAGAALAGLGTYRILADEPATTLTIARREIDIAGRSASVFGLRQPNGTAGYFARRGEPFSVRLKNALDRPTLVHWHGLTPPTAQDGVPELSQPALGSGGTYDYDFPLTRAGTFWMHSHFELQEQALLAAPLIVADLAEAKLDEQPVVVMLHDFSFRPAEEIMAGLRKGNMAGMDMANMGSSMAGMGAMAQDVNDIDFDAYLANDRTLADPQIVGVEPGGAVRLRVINASASTNYWIDLGAIEGALIAVDGDPVAPVVGARFPLAMAQRADIRLSLPEGPGAYPILALREGGRERTGIVLATKGAAVARIAETGEASAPILALDLEARLAAVQPLAARPADRSLPVVLGGDMMSYVWTMNGQVYGANTPLMVKTGERVELVMRNDTSMSHPMHLHGHHFQVVAIGERRFSGALRDTVLVPPRRTVVVAFDADNPGRWAFHCHNLYHMHAGMMGELRYEA